MTRMKEYGDSYHSPPRKVGYLSHKFPTFVFYTRFSAIIFCAYLKCVFGSYSRKGWYYSSRDIRRALEQVGGVFIIENIEAVERANGPAVIVANHMSTLETVVLPHILLAARPLAIVAKKSLGEYPIFGRVLSSVESIFVGRKSPREDLRVMLEEGSRQLQEGRNFLVFPQTTRSQKFHPETFNSIGVKLARRNNVPVIPLALTTDIWSNGRILKDIGPIDTTRPAHFAFGEPMLITGNGKEQHQACVDFIQGKLNEWQASAPTIDVVANVS